MDLLQPNIFDMENKSNLRYPKLGEWSSWSRRHNRRSTKHGNTQALYSEGFTAFQTWTVYASPNPFTPK